MVGVINNSRNDGQSLDIFSCDSLQHLYERSLEMRILLQKTLQGSLRLPLGSIPILDESKKSMVLSDASRRLAGLRRAALSTLEGMLGLQQALLCRNEVCMCIHLSIIFLFDPLVFSHLCPYT